jgi:drug/metabolite transporter (DMT)-like permease
LNVLGAGRIAIVDCFYVPFMVVMAMVMLDERLRPVQGVGAALVVIGVGVAEFQPGAAPADRRRTWQGMAAGLGGIFLMAVAILMVNPIIEAHPVLYVTEYRILVGFFTALPLLPLIDRRLPSGHWFGRDMPWGWMVLGTLLGVMLAMAFWISGFKYADASMVAVLNQTHIFFVILFAAFFLRERVTPRKIVGAALGFAGVAIIALA